MRLKRKYKETVLAETIAKCEKNIPNLDKERRELDRDLEYLKKNQEEMNEEMYNDTLEKYADFIRPGEASTHSSSSSTGPSTVCSEYLARAPSGPSRPQAVAKRYSSAVLTRNLCRK
jgi:hypothetical protein